ncbi:TetR family transcriptional regulator [Okibacterium endophyticum]
MRSPFHVSNDDLSTKARVRQAAIARFGRDGFDASVRTIAHDAGVSAAAVMKQFGSKVGLRRACDEYVFALIRDTKRSVVAERSSAPGVFIQQLARTAEYRPLIAYVLRSLQAGGEYARSFIDHMAEDALEYVTEGVANGLIVPSRDERARVRFLIGASLGNLLLDLATATDPHAVESDEFWERALGRLTLPALEIYAEGFLTDRSLLETYLLYMPDPPVETSGERA